MPERATKVTRRHVAILAARSASLWLMASGLAAAASLMLIRWPAEREAHETLISTALSLGVLPFATGLMLWSFAEPLANRLFRDAPSDGAPTTLDLYRVASAFVGLLLLAGVVPRVALWVSYFVLSFQTKSTILGPVGLQAEQRAMLFGIQTQSAALSTLVQAVFGLVLLMAPERISGALASVRRETIVHDATAREPAARSEAMTLIRQSLESDRSAILAIVNAAAQAYRGVIPVDRWHEPYMSADELAREISDGVAFWVAEEGGRLLGVMGIQDRGEVALVRHAYVAPNLQRSGVGTKLLRHVQGLVDKPILIGTWASASWAIEFYRRNGFTVLPNEDKDRVLRKYWSIPERQIETSVVLADGRWMADAAATGGRGVP
jgi:GNAT superfamily N-acetyltransferase